MKKLLLLAGAIVAIAPVRAENEASEKPDYGPIEKLSLKPFSEATRGLSVYGYLRWKYFWAGEPVGTETPSVEGTTWGGPSSYDEFAVWHFGPKGDLRYETATGSWHNGSWKQRGAAVYIETNNRYSEKIGIIEGDLIRGDGHNTAGISRWPWSARREPAKSQAK
ncbi:MAG TPA: hypothetical protein VF681_07280 [Abditibacteriaceae bacterium]|jgi:hypothetical protein